MKRYRVFNVIVTVLIFIGFTLLGIFVFRLSYCRSFEALIDLYGSFKYYFCVLFGFETNGLPSVILLSGILNNNTNLPTDIGGFADKTKDYFGLFFSKDNFSLWSVSVSGKLLVALKVLTLSLPIVLCLWLLVKRLYEKPNNNYNQDTKPLKAYKLITAKTIVPLRKFVENYINFIREHRYILIVWLIIWIFHLNLATIVIEFFAYYFFFAVSFNVGSIYTQFVKLFVDLQVIFTHVQLWILIVVGFVLFDRWRRNVAKNRLRHFETRNCGFINDLSIVTMACGSMGKKKTTLITDMTLSQEIMFRQKALEILQNADMKFPYFPWICFEKELQKCMEYHTVYNLATVKEWVAKKRNRYEKHGGETGQLYFYDEKRYGTIYRDGLKESNIFDILETYAQAYFVYVVESSLIVSNYAIRTDNVKIDNGNLPMWLTDFFTDDVRPDGFSHILDFDVLRLGKKVLENNPKTGSFEFGVVAITEIGKERGNNLELKEVKKVTNETNQKNDLFNSWLKMCRHSATIDNFPFIKVFTDEQRPESWGSDARDLCEILTIISAGEQRLALPFYTLEEMVIEWLYGRFIDLYADFRFRRGDNTLLVYILKTITARLWNRYITIQNKYGYSILIVSKQAGTMDGKSKRKKYYLMNQKIYSRRFTTDCFSDYFNDLAIKAKIGINDYKEYALEKASVNELKQQHSYFIGGLYGDK